MNNLIIRPARSDDLDNLVQLEKNCFDTDLMSRKSFQRLLKVSSALILVVQKDDVIIGSATLFFRKKSDTARIYSFAIEHTYRKQGLASQLNKAIEKYVRERECMTIVLEVRLDNIAAIKFYLKQGYVINGRYIKFYEDDADALRMEKIIYAKRKRYIS
ncbi:MAG: GNAT family N-acetyltransferase [Gammaproteobacteria bacterium]|nr:GNAT family N-acetyltransferase [Gammaproteobacteria bacterium]